jgi:hypothetical protein
MSQVTVHTSDGGKVSIAKMPDADVMNLIDDFNANPKGIITLTLGELNAITHINGRHIIRIDIDQEDQ